MLAVLNNCKQGSRGRLPSPFFTQVDTDLFLFSIQPRLKYSGPEGRPCKHAVASYLSAAAAAALAAGAAPASLCPRQSPAALSPLLPRCQSFPWPTVPAPWPSTWRSPVARRAAWSGGPAARTAPPAPPARLAPAAAAGQGCPPCPCCRCQATPLPPQQPPRLCGRQVASAAQPPPVWRPGGASGAAPQRATLPRRRLRLPRQPPRARQVPAGAPVSRFRPVLAPATQRVFLETVQTVGSSSVFHDEQHGVLAAQMLAGLTDAFRTQVTGRTSSSLSYWSIL
jgi:hypothetical protein